MSGSSMESLEREECVSNPKTWKEPGSDIKIGGHVRLRGEGGPGL